MTRGGRSLLLHTLLIAGGLLTLFPLLWMLSASFMASGEATTFPPHLIPHAATLAQYRALFLRLNIGRAFLSSAIVASIVTVSSVLFGSMAGYAFAKLRFGGRERMFGFLLTAIIVPPQVGMLPLFLLMKNLHLVNTYWGVIIPSMVTVFGIFLIRQFMLSVPQELLEAARIDGAGEFRIYWSVVMPLARPILATLATFMFMSTWNDFMWPLIILSNQSHHTLPVALANLLGEHVLDVELMMAGAVITVLPVLLVFLILQRYYIAGLMMGSVKG
ncbi:MAG: multiple sugar transport system permease protein [Thermoanaerobaculia bacterium]|jgi:multiple sugar transport system permease protein|nr:multiple sugar transport system permease protein [Thermoanaerobaculia bacterium]